MNLAKVDDDAETSKKQKCAVAKGGQVRTRRAAKDAVEADADDEDDGEWEGGSDDDARSCGYTPSPVRAKAGAGSSASPTRPQDITSANVLLAIVGSASKTGTTARKKKKGVVRGAGGFSDSEVSSDGMPTSPAPRRSIPRRRRLSPPPASDADAPTGVVPATPFDRRCNRGARRSVPTGQDATFGESPAGRQGVGGRNDRV